MRGGAVISCYYNPGSNSSFSTITSAGGGGGGRCLVAGTSHGGSGGGGGGIRGTWYRWTGNTPPVSPPQGNNGGTGLPVQIMLEVVEVVLGAAGVMDHPMLQVVAGGTWM